jgi:hypothetical protein
MSKQQTAADKLLRNFLAAAVVLGAVTIGAMIVMAMR